MTTNDKNIRIKAEKMARAFIKEDKQFHLGMLPTEKPHPYTMEFSSVIQENPVEGIRFLLDVDGDIAPVARRIFLSDQYDELVSAIVSTVKSNKKICFSGCGSTGRLAIMLEEMWRQFWEDRAGVELGTAAKTRNPKDKDLIKSNLASSIITGGDRALIRSVENFEDYPEIGARQIADLKLDKDDLLIAITEGGETSSVLGSVSEGLRRGCRVFLAFNNPVQILNKFIERSRIAIEDPQVISLDLYTGSMALTGSTRMQATTMEMLILGSALEEGLLAATGNEKKLDSRENKAEIFADLLGQIRKLKNIELIASLAEREKQVYEKNGLVTYLASRFLLDIFCDTTERTPTFMLPPFRSYDDKTSSQSWAYAKDPSENSDYAWYKMLRREPRGLNWSPADLKEIGVESATPLDYKEIKSYFIGNEPDSGRTGNPPNWFLNVILSGFNDYKKILEGEEILLIGSESKKHSGVKYHFDISIRKSFVYLWHHLAIKILFNTISTSTMGMMGRIKQNWMVQLDPTNKKLVDRGSRIIAQLSGLTYEQACTELYFSLLERTKMQDKGVAITTSPVVATLKRLGKWG